MKEITLINGKNTIHTYNDSLVPAKGDKVMVKMFKREDSVYKVIDRIISTDNSKVLLMVEEI